MDNANAFNNNTANKNGQLSSNYVFFLKTITISLILILQTTSCIVAVSFIMVEETGVHEENHCPAASH
jgi:hypothetical protein